MSLLCVIERPQWPAVRRMTRLALVAKASFVNVLMRVAIAAGRGCTAEGQRGVALRTAHHPMQAEQRKFGQVMIESKAGAPILLAVALVAGILELAAVRILAAMASGAVLGELLRGNYRGMAGVAIDLGVSAGQRILVALRVIVIRQPPTLIVMTVAAFRSKTGGMGIVSLVAAVAILGNLVVVVAAAMTGDAIGAVVHSEKFVAGFLEMIILRGFPLFGHMAFRAILAARSAVLIVGRMATDAALRGRLVVAADVTSVAGDVVVGSRQLELRLVVIELTAAPGRGVMALTAGLRQLRRVNVIRLVAAVAGRDDLAPLLGLLVATVAIQGRVRALQREVGEMMIELRTAELHDVGGATLVF